VFRRATLARVEELFGFTYGRYPFPSVHSASRNIRIIPAFPACHIVGLHLWHLVTLHSVAALCCIPGFHRAVVIQRHGLEDEEALMIEHTVRDHQTISRRETTACIDIRKPLGHGQTNTTRSHQQYFTCDIEPSSNYLLSSLCSAHNHRCI
jgi:hypothetical protein